METIKLIVFCNHATRAAPWHGEHEFRVKAAYLPDGSEGFYAYAPHFGAGRAARSPYAAVSSLANANACSAAFAAQAPAFAMGA